MPWSPSTRRVFIEPEELLLPELRMVGWDHFHAARQELAEHMHPQAWEICYIVRGRVEWWAENSLCEVHGGEIYITRPGERHGGVDAMMHPCELFWLQTVIPAQGVMGGLTCTETRLLRRRFAAMTLRTFPGSPEIAEAFEHLMIAHEQRSPLSTIAARATLHQLLLLVLDCHDRHAAALSQSAPSSKLQKAIDWMRQHLKEDYAIEDAAEVAGLSISHFHELFVKQTGFTPADFRQHERIQLARQLLRNSDQSITRIGHGLGFSTSQYFATVFKKIVGLTPRAYRRQMQPTEKIGSAKDAKIGQD